jgi:hypothetical protein
MSDNLPDVDLRRLAALVADIQARQTPAPAPARPVGQYLAAGAGAAAVLIPVLLATTAALIAAGMAALALAISALVIRWIIRDMQRR